MTQPYAHILRVRYSETDQMGIVYHARYLDWFEVARTELIRSHGVNYRKLEEDQGLLLPVVDVALKYRQPARYDDEIALYARVQEAGAVRLIFAYEIRRLADDLLLVEGTTGHLWVNRDWKPIRIDRSSPELYRFLQQLEQAGKVEGS